MNSILKSAPLLLAAGLALSSANAAHAQVPTEGGFTFTAPTSGTLVVHPGDSILFSGTFQNQALEQIDSVTIGLSPGSYGGKFTFASPFFATLGIGQSQKFTGTLKVSSTATFSTTAFYLDANGLSDSNPNTSYDFGSSNFIIKLAPAAAVPEASSVVSTGILLMLGLGGLALRSRTPCL